jgi:hypothetical protein
VVTVVVEVEVAMVAVKFTISIFLSITTTIITHNS